MLLKLLADIGIKNVKIAGMDGYLLDRRRNYLDDNLEYDFSKEAEVRNNLISAELTEINKRLALNFITPTCYGVNV
jgi:4-hydroxy 2-oxovalerate aldolase